MEQTDWHLDKKVPISLIIAIIIQTSAGVWFLSNQSAQLSEVVSHNSAQDSRLGALETVTQGQAIAAATITQQISAIKDRLDQVQQDQREMNALLRQVLEKQK